MSDGPGKYDTWCTLTRSGVHAEGVIMMVINGVYGSGFSCQATRRSLLQLPIILRDMADQIEKDNDSRSNPV